MAMSQSSEQSEGSQDFVEGRLLDGFLLLAAGGSSSPEDVVSVNLSSLQIVDVAAEDLTFFGNLDSLDVSDNQLSYDTIIEQFGRLIRLTKLLLSCNSISSLQVPHGTLRLLETLDLSFNELHGDVLSQLAHLPRLTKLNLSSNCISSVPPEEELYGLQALEELSLDANDLVQFVQWRALDVLPRLRKLSLASNRVKRLKDDTPESSGDISYFPALQELDLSANEIARMSDLPAVRLFRALRVLNLSDNECTRAEGGMVHDIPKLKLKSQATKPWYLLGNGSHVRREKVTQPRLKLDRRKMRRVRSHTKVSSSGATATSQLGVYDEEANRLLVDLRGKITGAPLEGGTVGQAAIEAGYGAAAFLTAAPDPSEDLTATCPVMLSDDLSEEELEEIFRERRRAIDKQFHMPVEEPTSFMRTPPFEHTASAGGLASGTFITGGGEEAADASSKPSTGTAAAASQREARLRSTAAQQTPVATPTSSAAAGAAAFASPATSSASSAAGAAGAGLAPALAAMQAAAAVTLPPIQEPGSRGSSAGTRDRPDPLDVLLKDSSVRGRMMPDVGVREAMKALRAASMSEYAVAA